MRAARIVDAVARAQIVEPVGPGRMLAARQQQRIDQPLARDQCALDALEFGAQEAVIESGIVDHQRRIADEGKEIVDDLDETLVALQKFARQAVNGKCLGRHVALGIDDRRGTSRRSESG